MPVVFMPVLMRPLPRARLSVAGTQSKLTKPRCDAAWARAEEFELVRVVSPRRKHA